jgi:hypothetical protein
VKLRHASFGEWTSKLFVEGEPGNSSDLLWCSLKPAKRQAAAMWLQAGSADTGVRWVVQQALVVPAGWAGTDTGAGTDAMPAPKKCEAGR